MSAHQSRREIQEVPLGAGGVQDFAGVDVEVIEDDGRLVHQRNIQVALRILDDLRGLSHLDRTGTVHTGCHHRAIDLCHQIKRRGIRAGHDLHDIAKRVLLVAGINALRTVAHREIHAQLEARFTLEDRDADFLGDAGIDGRFVHHHVAAFERPADRFGRLFHRHQIRLRAGADWRGHRDNMKIGLTEHLDAIG